MDNIKEIYIYSPSNMPVNGWLHACFTCREYTSRTLLFANQKKDDIEYKFYVHCCPRCKRTHSKIDKYEEFTKKCNLYIYNRYFSLTS